MKKLGFGTMRLPLINGDDPKSIDFAQVEQMVDAFLAAGFTYFDTAYPYHEECPIQVNVPAYFGLLNLYQTLGKKTNMYYERAIFGHAKASECLKCGKCEKICPQHIPIRQILLDPVNLLSMENVDAREEVIGEALELLAPDIAMLHFKDFLREDSGGQLKAVGPGPIRLSPLPGELLAVANARPSPTETRLH